MPRSGHRKTGDWLDFKVQISDSDGERGILSGTAEEYLS